MRTYLCEVIDTNAGDNADEVETVVSCECLTFECAKSFVESSMLRLVPSFHVTRAEWAFTHGKAVINSEDVGCPVYAIITSRPE